MSVKTNSGNEYINRERRDIVRAAGMATLSGVAASLLAPASPVKAQHTSMNRDTGPLGARLQGAQHFGLTVQNMDRAFEFYTKVLGGTEAMRDGDFQGARMHNTLLTDQDIEAGARQVNPRTMGIPDLKG